MDKIHRDIPPEASVVTKFGSLHIHELAAIQRLVKRIEQSSLNGKKLLNKRAYILGSVEETVRAFVSRNKHEAYSVVMNFIRSSAWADDIAKYVKARQDRT